MIRSKRSALSAIALATMLILPTTVFAADRTGRHHRPFKLLQLLHEHAPVQRGRMLSGRLVSIGNTTAPATLTVQLTRKVSITVSVATTTTIVRRYNGRSSLLEFSLGDRLLMRGHFDPTTKYFDAAVIKNMSIQLGYTTVVGRIAKLNSNGVIILRVVRRHGFRAPYFRGEFVWISLLSSTTIMAGGTTSNAAALQPGLQVVVLGLYDRHTRQLRAYRVRIVSGSHARFPQPQPQPTLAPPPPPPTDTATVASMPTMTPTAIVTPTATMTPTATIAPTSTMTPTVAPTSTLTPTATIAATATTTATVGA